MALNSIQQEIGQAFGYTPLTAEEACEQYQADINYDPKKFRLDDEETHPVTGSVFSRRGKLRCYWKPEYGDESLEGWYDVPLNEDIEEQIFDSIAFTPAEDEVEPDHPDSWLSILGLI